MEHLGSSKTQSPAQGAKQVSSQQLPKDEVQSRAYQIFLSRNRQPGHALDDWLQAERELLSRN